jgi:hypothetical protein
VPTTTPQPRPLHLYTRFFAARCHDVDAMIEMLELYGEAKRWRLEQAASKKGGKTTKGCLWKPHFPEAALSRE